MKKSTLIKIIIFIVLIILVVFLLYTSKKFFDENHNSYQTLESNIKVYKVHQQNDEEAVQPSEPRIIEETPVEFHENPTDVIIDNIIQKEQERERVDDIKNNEKTQTLEEETTESVEQKVKKIPNKNQKTKDLPITTPKTLENKNIAKSVLNNPLFHSYIIQVGAFSNIQDAEAKKNQLITMPIVSRYSLQINQSGEYYKVVIGFFDNPESARNLCIELKKQNVQCFTTRL